MKITYRLFLVLLIGIFIFGCGSKKSGIEGKVVDGKGQPISGLKITVRQVQPVKDYEQFETLTGTDGIFRFAEVMPASAYTIIPSSDKWTTKINMKVITGAEGQTFVLNKPLVIRFQVAKNGSVTDSKTSLQWLIYAAKDLSSENVLNSVKNIKEGGFNDWRLPTKSELAALAVAAVVTPGATTTRETCCVWTSEPNSEKVDWDFYIDDNNDLWAASKIPANDRIVVVRNSGGTPAVTQKPAVAVLPAASTPATAKHPAASIPAPAAENKEVSASRQVSGPVKTAVPAPVVEKKELAKKAAPAEKAGTSPVSGSVIIYFTMNKSVIAPEDMAKLKDFYAKIKGASGKVVIEGHTDSLGSASSKLKVSIERSLKVFDTLKKIGLSDKIKVELKGVGDAKAAAENDSEEGRKLNRRVELFFIPE